VALKRVRDGYAQAARFIEQVGVDEQVDRTLS
jgi:hypothetical protein